MKNNLQYLLPLAILVLTNLLLSCNNGPNSAAPSADSTGSEKYIVNNSYDFSTVPVEHSGLPIQDLDSLRTVRLTVGEYYRISASIDSSLAKMQSDTTIPPRLKMEYIEGFQVQRQQIHDYGYIMKVKSQCGEHNKTENVEAYKNTDGVSSAFVLSKSKSVGLLKWNKFGNQFNGLNDRKGTVEDQPWGTGALIGNDLFITALHCFQPDIDESTTPIKNNHKLQNNELCLLMRVLFRYQYKGSSTIDLCDTIGFPVIDLIETGAKHNLDYAIVRLGTNKGKTPGETFGHLVPLSTPDTKVGDTLCIIQHPQGKPKRVGNGKLSNQNDLYIYYDAIDTYKGSSGAPVINYSSGKLEGINIGGNCTQSGKGSNQAIKIQVIQKVSSFFRK